MINEALQEVIFVGLPGPTHNYGGLSQDNVAATTHRGNTSSPKQAALQVLALVRLLASYGIETGILPPQQRPHLPTLKAYFHGSAEAIIEQAAKNDPALLEHISSSSAMWAANAATVSPGIDNRDGKLHLTTANLHTNLHRRIEAHDTHRALAAIFAAVPDTCIHPPLDAERGQRDEGAANHMRLAPRHTAPGIHLFVYGADGSGDDPPSARQTLLASQAIRDLHGIHARQCLFIKQNPEVIRAGVFHNDVIAVSNESLLLAHEKAFAGGQAEFDRIAQTYHAQCGEYLHTIIIPDHALSVEEAVHSYFFNSQIVTRRDGTMTIIAPTEVQQLYDGKAARLMQQLCSDPNSPISEIHYIDLRQSMHNGGGPACLRLRVVMETRQLAAIKTHVRVMVNETLLGHIERVIERHYPETLQAKDIANPELYFCCRTVMRELVEIMNLPLL